MKPSADRASADPLVTVVMPVKNPAENFFREAVACVQAQTTPRWRLCVVVDEEVPVNSGSETLQDLCRSTDERVTVLQNESTLLTGALNTAMRHVETPFAAVLHCDDALDTTVVHWLDEYIERYPEADYFHTARRYIDGQGHSIGSLRHPQENVRVADFKRLSPVKNMHCWRVQAALEIGGMDESLGLHGADDYEFPWRMAEADKTFQAVPEAVYIYRDHREHFRLTTHVPLDKQVEELTKIFQKHGMTEEEIAEQINIRKASYLRQALFRDETDRQRKEARAVEGTQAWRQSYG